MSTRSSPLSSPNSSPLPKAAAVLPSALPTQASAGASRAPSTSSSLSNADDAGMPPSSLPDAEVGDGGDEDDGTDATSETVPLGSTHAFESDSDLTEEDEEEGEELPGPPLGIRPVATPAKLAGATIADETEQTTPQASGSGSNLHTATRPSPTHSNPSIPATSAKGKKRRNGHHSPSPSLSPPPPRVASPPAIHFRSFHIESPTGSPTASDPRPEPPAIHFRNFGGGSPTASDSGSSQGAKRKREAPNGGLAAGEASGSGSAELPTQNAQANGHRISQIGAGDHGAAIKDATLAIEQTLAKAPAEDLPLPENTDDPDAQMAFLDALDAFDAEDLGQAGAEAADIELEERQEDPGPAQVNGDIDTGADSVAQLQAGPEGIVQSNGGAGLGETEVAEDTVLADTLPEELAMAEEFTAETGLAGTSPSSPGAEETNVAVSTALISAELANVDTREPSPADAEPPAPPGDAESALSPAPTPVLASTPMMPAPTQTHSSHAPPPSQAAMRALLTLELKFAALRDRLYIERMEEAAEEEEMVLNGTHPALQQLYKTLSHRRERLHELASRRHAQAMEELKVVRKGEQDAVWSWWTDERDRMHWGEFEQTWSKRRRLAREKNEIESVRWARPVPVVGDPRFGKGFDWSAGPSPARLSADEGSHDLALMEHRQIQLSRHASPATFPPLPNFPMNHQHQQSAHAHAQQQHQQQVSQYASYSGPTYAEAAGTSAAAGYGESPRVPSGGAPRSRLGTPAGGASTNIARQPSQTYGGPGLMDHLAYPRNATALGPTSSGSSISFFQPLSQTQSQQQRREGRTVPTASTMFGPNSSHSNTNSPISQSFPFNQTPAQSLPSNPNASQPNGNSTLQNGMSKEVKQENIEHGPWGSRVHVPMGFGLGFGLGGGGSAGSTAGFGTLGPSPAPPPPSLDQPPSYTAVFAAGAASAAEGIEKQAKVATPTSSTPTPNELAAPSPAVSTSAGGSAFWTRLPGSMNGGVEKSVDGLGGGKADVGAPNGPSTYSSGLWNSTGETSSLEGKRPDGSGRVDPDAEDETKREDRLRQEDILHRRAEALEVEARERERMERERERDRPKYPGLAEYLGSSSTAAFASGLGRLNARVGNGPLSPPGVGVARSPFPSQPPAVIPNPQTASRS